MYEDRTVGTDDSPEHLGRFAYSNHLGSASLELNEDAKIISYEEYHPYGTTSYQAMNAAINAVAKRYRYTGKERDEESGLYYHGARYYACWLARWTAVDPKEGERAGLSGYNYCQNNPVMRHDPDGMRDEKKGEQIHAGLAGGLGAAAANAYNRMVNRGTKSGKSIQLTKISGSASDNTSSATRRVADTRIQVVSQPPEITTLVQGIDGRVANVKESQAEKARFKLNEEYYNQVADNIRGGPMGAAGGMIAGERGTFVGSGFDGLMMSFANPGTPFGKLEAVEPVIEPKTPLPTEAPVVEVPPPQAQAAVSSTADGKYTVTLTEQQAAAVNNAYLMRGTTEGFEGGPTHVRNKITPTTPNPAKATLFAIESGSNHGGDPVVHIASKEDLTGVNGVPENVLAHIEEEIPLDLLPKEFAERAGITITAEQSREILKQMGINLPSRVTLETLSTDLREIPTMTQAQIDFYVQQAKLLMK